jgi:hypothetical protein
MIIITTMTIIIIPVRAAFQKYTILITYCKISFTLDLRKSVPILPTTHYNKFYPSKYKEFETAYLNTI